MAKDGTKRGGPRVGAGQPKKPLHDKILEGNPGRILANGCAIVPFSCDMDKPHVDTLYLEEGCIIEGAWKMSRRLNGDEIALRRCEKPTLLKMKLFAYN